MAETLPATQRASYAAIIDDILVHADLDLISAKAIRQGMQDRVDYDLTPQKSAITALIMERFDKAQRDREGASNDDTTQEPAPTTNGHHNGDHRKKRKAEQDDDDDDDSELSSVESEPATKKIKNNKVKPEADSDAALAAKLQAEFNAQARSTRGGGVTKRKTVVKKEKKHKKKSAARVGSDDDSEVEGGAPDDTKEKKGGFHKLMTLSEPLSALLGEPALSRPQTVKKIWAYVKERDLQDPDDKRQIRCDDAMRAVFKQDRVHMFTMNKILAGHLYPHEG
ncbi:hypothetical protein AMS68_005788 [Peltaster fructicola]|uniref:Uncharacterized protein n=1 Tax=Peltaster fructicola TaxID=286661 RepID=A0A6H0Y028_9PEZI|nr:hypothetical protein AMS68_005788 [Peltaster fructicola]